MGFFGFYRVFSFGLFLLFSALDIFLVVVRGMKIWQRCKLPEGIFRVKRVPVKSGANLIDFDLFNIHSVSTNFKPR
jgi:hypothetical protein